MEEKVDALVLRSIDYKDNDKILTLFTLQNGKVTAAAKGVKKAGARLKFAAQPFCFAEYVLAKKGERRTVISAANTDGFYALREDIEKFYAACAVCEVCDALLFEGIVNEELFLYAVNALKNMCEGNAAEELVRFRRSARCASRGICSRWRPAQTAAAFWKGGCISTSRAAAFTARNAPRARARAKILITFCGNVRIYPIFPKRSTRPPKAVRSNF